MRCSEPHTFQKNKCRLVTPVENTYSCRSSSSVSTDQFIVHMSSRTRYPSSQLTEFNIIERHQHMSPLDHHPFEEGTRLRDINVDDSGPSCKRVHFPHVDEHTPTPDNGTEHIDSSDLASEGVMSSGQRSKDL